MTHHDHRFRPPKFVTRFTSFAIQIVGIHDVVATFGVRMRVHWLRPSECGRKTSKLH